MTPLSLIPEKNNQIQRMIRSKIFKIEIFEIIRYNLVTPGSERKMIEIKIINKKRKEKDDTYALSHKENSSTQRRRKKN